MIPYTVKKSTRAKNIRITITTDASVVITIPHRASISIAEKFFMSKYTWVEEKVTKMSKNIFNQKIPRSSIRDYKKYKEDALSLTQKKLLQWNKFYNFKWNRVTIRNTSSRWGSCSKNKNLNFNYRIIYLPEALQDYLIVHELCHLKELNHSSHFWQLIEKTLPNYLELRKELRQVQ